MFDRIIDEDFNLLFRCDRGHQIIEFKTQDLGCNGQTYVIADGNIFVDEETYARQDQITEDGIRCSAVCVCDECKDDKVYGLKLYVEGGIVKGLSW